MAKLAPLFNEAQFIDGIPANGAKLFTYVAGSSTKQATFTDEAGLTPQANPIILNSRGEPAQAIWLTDGASYKFVFAPATDSDPPVSPIRTIDNITGVNDASLTIDQWVDSGFVPTYVSPTVFTVPGDQTSAFQVNRRVKLLVTAGTVYGYISASAFAALTTVTVVLDSGVLDSGLSSVQLGLITPTNTSMFLMQTGNIANSSITPVKLSSGAPRWDANGRTEFFANAGSVSHIFTFEENGGQIELHNNAGVLGTLIDLSVGNSRLLHNLTTGDMRIGLGTITSGNLSFMRSGFIESMRISSTGDFLSVIPGGALLMPYFHCRAWINFNGTGTPAIRGSGNISSITDNGIGDYTLNFTTAFPDINYSVVGNSGVSASLSAVSIATNGAGARVAPTVSAVRIATTNFSAPRDSDDVNLAIFR